MSVVIEQVVAVLLQQTRPAVFWRNLAGLVVRRLRPLVGHLEKQQIRQLFDVVAVAHPVVTEDVAVVPEFLDDLRRLGGHVRGTEVEQSRENAL
jgi:hypothetical protein